MAERVWGEVKTSPQGTCTITDTLLIGQYLAGKRTLTPEQLAAADVDGDGAISQWDIVWIREWLSVGHGELVGLYKDTPRAQTALARIGNPMTVSPDNTAKSVAIAIAAIFTAFVTLIVIARKRRKL